MNPDDLLTSDAIRQAGGVVIPILGDTKQVAKDTLELLVHALGNTLTHLSALDASNAAANLAEVRPRPLTLMVMSALDELQKVIGE